MLIHVYMYILTHPLVSIIWEEKKCSSFIDTYRREERKKKILVPLFCLFLLSFNLNIHAGNIYLSVRCCCCCFLINPLQSLMCMKRKREISHWSRSYFVLPYRSYVCMYVCNIRRKKRKGNVRYQKKIDANI